MNTGVYVNVTLVQSPAGMFDVFLELGESNKDNNLCEANPPINCITRQYAILALTSEGKANMLNL